MRNSSLVFLYTFSSKGVNIYSIIVDSYAKRRKYLMTLQKKKTVSVSYIIRVIIAVALMFGFGLLPPIPGLEKLGMQILGIFLGLIFSWICIGFT